MAGVLGAGFVLGYLTHREGWVPVGLRDSVREAVGIESGPDLQEAWSELDGSWGRARDAAGGLSQAEIEAMLAVGYLGGSVPPPDASGVTVHVRDRVRAGLNLWNSGHASVATLMDMDGKVLHEWRKEFAELWPDFEAEGDSQYHRFWRRVRLLADGSLLAIWDGLGLVKLDVDSNVVWALRGGYHHDLDLDLEGRIYVLTREPRVVPAINADAPVLEDFVAVLDADGNEVRRVSILDAVMRSPQYAPWLLAGESLEGDVLHTNSLELLDPRFAQHVAHFVRGNVLLSLREVDALAVLDMKTERIVWGLTRATVLQHDPELLENAHVLVFDNLGANGRSRVIEINPLTQEVAWVYANSEATPLFSSTSGAVQRLSNGNTLISESNRGRAIEVTPEGEIVWEYLNAERAGDHNEFIATIFEMQRLESAVPDGFLDWLD